jgi:hypothetical protein
MADDFLLDRLNAFNAKVPCRAHSRPPPGRTTHGPAPSVSRPHTRTRARCALSHAPPLAWWPRQFALPGLLYRNIATTDLYSADWRIVGASITFKARTHAACGASAPQKPRWTFIRCSCVDV